VIGSVVRAVKSHSSGKKPNFDPKPQKSRNDSSYQLLILSMQNKRIFKLFFCICFIAWSISSILAEESTTEQTIDVEKQQSVQEESYRKPKRYFGRAFLQANASNLAIWSWDYFAIHAPWAQISLESWKTNLQQGFDWDNSIFFTNQILHPYQGSTYFNAARLNGYSFWESTPFSFYGSLMWEYFMERNQPSTNDLITTTIGGIAMGEAGYRISLALIDTTETGYKRALREIGSLVANPVLFFNRIIYGDDDVLRRNAIPHTKLDLAFYFGMNVAHDDFALFEAIPNPFFGFFFNYGDPYNSHEFFKPYEYFSMQCGVDVINITNAGMEVFAHAILLGKKLYVGEWGKGVLGCYQHFDYLENDMYKFASNGAGIGSQLYFPFLNTMGLELQLHLYGIALGGVDSDYTKEKMGKDYTLGPGIALKSELKYSLNSLFSCSVFYNHYWLYTLRGSDTENKVDILSTFFEFAMKSDLHLGVEYHLYARWSDAGIDNSHTYGLRTYLSYIL